MFLGRGQSLKPPYSNGFHKVNCHPELVSGSHLKRIIRAILRFAQNDKRRYAFTLTELLMALTIVGVLAVLTVPILINNFQNRLFATQIKNFSAEIEQFAQDQLITHKTRDLMDTDFGEPSKLLTDGHFSIVKICTAEDSLKDCWKTEAEGKDKVKYKYLYNRVAGVNSGLTVILKNGLMFRYQINTIGGKKYARILVDVNGTDKPNICGRDLFGFYMDSKGHIVGIPIGEPYEYSVLLNSCKTSSNKTSIYTGAYYCYSALVNNNWKMDY